MKRITPLNIKMSNYNRDNDSGYGISPENSDSESDEENCKYVKTNGNFEDINSCLKKLQEANQQLITTAKLLENKYEPKTLHRYI